MEFEKILSVTFSAVTDGKVIGTGSMAGRLKSGDQWIFSVHLNKGFRAYPSTLWVGEFSKEIHVVLKV